MKKKGWYLLLVVAVVAILFYIRVNETQNPKEPMSSASATVAQGPKAPTYRMPRQLTGKVCAVLLFVDDEESSWSAKDVAEYEREKIQPGIEFLKEQAAAYGADLTLTTMSYSTTEGRPIYYDGIIGCNFTVQEENGKTKVYPDSRNVTGLDKILERVAVNWGFESVNEFNQAMLDYTGADRIGYVAISNKRGWDNASCSYAKSPWGKEQEVTTFPHEFLHLFGGEDLYQQTMMDGTVRRKNRAAMTQQLHENAIMYSGVSELENAIVCGYTAYAVGWLEELPEVYNCEEWNS